MTGKPGSHWPAEKLAKLRDFEAKNVPIKEMARRLKCSASTIRRQREHLHIAPRPSPIIYDQRPDQTEHIRRVQRGASTLPPLQSSLEDER
jgi:hypothetical protein